MPQTPEKPLPIVSRSWDRPIARAPLAEGTSPLSETYSDENPLGAKVVRKANGTWEILYPNHSSERTHGVKKSRIAGSSEAPLSNLSVKERNE